MTLSRHVETEVVWTGYEPHPGQLEFHQSSAKFRAAITGVGGGKTAMGAIETIRMAMMYPDAVHLIMAPNYKILKNATLPQFWKWLPHDMLEAHIKSQGKIILKNGAVIIYLTADNERHIDRLRGIEIGSAWLDEAALFLRSVWDVLMGRLRDPNGPLRIWITTTPKGLYHWTSWVFVKQRNPETREPLPNAKDYEWFNWTSHDNPHTPEEYKQTLEMQYSGAFKRQEIYGDLVAFEGMVYDNFSHKEHVLKKRQDYKVEEDRAWVKNPTTGWVEVKEWIVGSDFGFQNPMACLLIALDNDDRAYCIIEFYKRRQHVEDIRDWLNKQMGILGIDYLTVYCDPAQPGNIDMLARMGFNAQRADNQVLPGIQEVYDRFGPRQDGTRGLYVFDSCPNLIEEIGQYRYDKKKEGRDVKEQPVKEKDHATDALRYAIRTHLGQGRSDIHILEDPDNIMGLG